MKSSYWIGIMAVAGSVIGTIIGLLFFPDASTASAVSGMVIGMTIGMGMYTHYKKQEEESSK